jgi:hypothetical protein
MKSAHACHQGDFMNRDLLKQIIADQELSVQKVLAGKKIIKRDRLDDAKRFVAQPNVLLLSGIRRSGKSTFAHQMVSDRSRAAINFDDERLIGFKAEHFNLLIQVFSEVYGAVEFALFDEIQNIPGWELFINRIRQDYKIIITGSNANLLSSELATHLTGRFDVVSLFPMSWKEYLFFSGKTGNPLKTFSTIASQQLISLSEAYLQGGGIFEYYSFGREHIRTLFSSIIHKDIFGRFAVSFPHVLEELAQLMITSFASKISVRKLAAHFNVKSPHTIKEYLRYLENTFCIFSIGKWSYKLREQQSAAKKVYIADNGIIDSLSFSFSSNRGRLLENAVAIELTRRGLGGNGQVFYWDDYHNECDFIVRKNNTATSAVQVCYELTETNIQREKAGLLKAMNAFSLKEGHLITLSQSNEETINGKTIRTVPFYRWAYEE